MAIKEHCSSSSIELIREEAQTAKEEEEEEGEKEGEAIAKNLIVGAQFHSQAVNVAVIADAAAATDNALIGGAVMVAEIAAAESRKQKRQKCD